MACRSEIEAIASNFETTSSIKLDGVSLFATGKVTYSEWANKGKELRNIMLLSKRHVPFWLGDLLLLGEQLFPESYTQIVDTSMYSYNMAMKMMYVCKKIPRHRRRDPSVCSFQHHYTVVNLPENEQEYWLELCIDRGWTVKQFRDRVYGHVPIDAHVPIKAPPIKTKERKYASGVDQTLVESLEKFSIWWKEYKGKSISTIQEQLERKIAKDAWEASRFYMRNDEKEVKPEN